MNAHATVSAICLAGIIIMAGCIIGGWVADWRAARRSNMREGKDAMAGLRKMAEQRQEKRSMDAARFTALDDDECMMCGAYGEDKRSLYMACFYAIEEVVPEAIDLHDCPEEGLRGRGYYLRICKDCRGRFLGHLGQWREECQRKRGTPMDHDGHPCDDYGDDRNIPVRQNGRIVWMTRERES